MMTGQLKAEASFALYDLAGAQGHQPTRAQVALAWALAAVTVAGRLVAPAVCAVRGCRVEAEEHGDAESGPRGSWGCARCGRGGRW